MLVYDCCWWGTPPCGGHWRSRAIEGPSVDDVPVFEQQLQQVANSLKPLPLPKSNAEVQAILENIPARLPSIRFGVETALIDAMHGGRRLLYEGEFTEGQQQLPINGLIWMGNETFMQQQIEAKLQEGYTCLKMKIGAIDFTQECKLLQLIRKHAPPQRLVLRVDANGAFTPDDAMHKLEKLATYHLHSIEQPIAASQAVAMHQLCRHSPVPIALDEELIGITEKHEQAQLLDAIKPQYIILKPGLLGGLAATQQWIDLANDRNIGWWLTSALESNIGLNAISQFTAISKATGHQGLGTGQLYHNNIKSPLQIQAGFMRYTGNWDVTPIVGARRLG